MFIRDLADVTRTRLKALGMQSSVYSAAEAFADARLGLIIICDDADRAQGVVSKSDLVRHLAGIGEVGSPVTEVMTSPFVAGSPDDDLRTTWQLMVTRRLQNLPLLSADRKPLGTLDIRDALQAILKLEESQEVELVNYIAGNGYH